MTTAASPSSNTPDATSSRWSLAILLLVTIAGGILRFWNLGHHSLWLDEAWLANSLRSDSLTDVIFRGPGDVPNSTPFLLSLSIHGITRLFDDTEFWLRFLPAVFSTLSIVVFYFFARRMGVGTFAAMAGTIFLAFHPVSIDYAKELKQYAGDTYWLPLFLLGVLDYSRRPSISIALLLSFGGLVALGFAQTIALGMPGAVIALVIPALRRREPFQFPYRRVTALIILFWGVGIALIYWFVLRHQTSPDLVRFWQEFFPASPRIADVLHHGRVQFGNFLNWFFETKHWAVGLVLLLGILWQIIRRPLHTITLVLMPGLVALGLSAFGKFPFGGMRVNLFLLPFFILSVVFFIDAVVWLIRRVTVTRNVAAIESHGLPLRSSDLSFQPVVSNLRRMWFIAAHVIPLVALAVYLAIPRFDKEMHDPKEREELRPLLERMLAMYRDGDTVILIDHYPSYAFKYYTRGRTIATHPGKTIWKDSVLVRYIAKLAPESGRVWIVMSHTPREAMLEVVAKVSRRWPTVAVMDRRDAIVAFFAAEPKPRRLRTDEYDFRPPNRPERAAMAHDDDPETNWLSEGYKEPGWHIDIELHEPTALSAVILNAKIWPDDWSHELYAAVQVDGDDSWQSTGLSVWEGPRTTVNFDGPPVPVRRVRLTNAERSDTYCWSVHELEIWARPAPAASQPTR